MAAPVIDMPTDGELFVIVPPEVQIPILVQGTSDPLAAILYYVNGNQRGNSSADGTGVWGTTIQGFTAGDHEIVVTADGVPSQFITIHIGVRGVVVIDVPFDGQDYESPSVPYIVTVNGRTNPPLEPVMVMLDGNSRIAVSSDTFGNFTDDVQVDTFGFHFVRGLIAVDGSQIYSPAVAFNILHQVTPPARPPLLTDGSFTYYMNWLAGLLDAAGNPGNQTPLYTATFAANVLAGTSGMTLTGALNRFAGNRGKQYRTVIDILNTQAGTKGFTATAALYRIAQNIPTP